MQEHEQTWSAYALGPVAAAIVAHPNRPNSVIARDLHVRKETVRRLRTYLANQGRTAKRLP